MLVRGWGSLQDYTTKLSKSLGIIYSSRTPIVHSQLDYCGYCIKSNESYFSFYFFWLSDPSKRHQENYQFSDFELKLGIVNAKVRKQ